MTFQKKTDDVEFIDAEDQSFYQKEQLFSHQSLVMESIRRCLEVGSHEMRTGWFNKKTDNLGNTTLTYIEDTRRKFIESVKSAEMVMTCDFEETAKLKIKELKKQLEDKRRKLLEEQWEWYSNLGRKEKFLADEKYGQTQQDYLNPNIVLHEVYINFELEIYRLICTELNNLTKRLGFYEMKTIQE